MNSATTLIDLAAKKRQEKLAKSTGRNRFSPPYLDLNEWQNISSEFSDLVVVCADPGRTVIGSGPELEDRR